MSFSNPPLPMAYDYGDIPAFLKKYTSPRAPKIDTAYILDLFRWAEFEYNDMIAYCTLKGYDKYLETLRTLSPLNFLAENEVFEMVLKNLTAELWASYPKVVRTAIKKTKAIYDARSK